MAGSHVAETAYLGGHSTGAKCVWVTTPGTKGHQGVGGCRHFRVARCPILFLGQTFKEQRWPSGP